MLERYSNNLKFIAVIALSMMIVVGFADHSQAQSAKDAYQIEEFNMGGGEIDLEVVTSGGSITVVGKRGSTVEVQMFARRNGEYLSPDDVDLSDWNFEFKRENDRVRAIAKRDSDRRWNRNTVSISFVVYTPIETLTDLKTSGGSIKIENLKGSQEANTSGGSITLNDLDGNVDVKTSGGSIQAENIGGYLQANTSGGRISVKNASGDVDLSTSGGAISIEGVSGNVEAKTSGGSIEASLNELGERVELATSGGSIRIEVPKGSGLDLELSGNSVRTDLENFSGSSKRNRVEGTVNGGGTKVSARTSGGSVTLRYN